MIWWGHISAYVTWNESPFYNKLGILVPLSSSRFLWMYLYLCTGIFWSVLTRVNTNKYEHFLHLPHLLDFGVPVKIQRWPSTNPSYRSDKRRWSSRLFQWESCGCGSWRENLFHVSVQSLTSNHFVFQLPGKSYTNS